MALPTVNWNEMYKKHSRPDNEISEALTILREGHLELLEGDAYVTCGRHLEHVAQKYGVDIALAACVSLILSYRWEHKSGSTK